MFQIAVAPEIEIRQWTLADADACFETVVRNRASLREWLPWVDRTCSAEDIRQYIRSVAIPQYEGNQGPICAHLGRRQTSGRHRLSCHRLGEPKLRAGLLARCRGSLTWRDDEMLCGASPLPFRGVEAASRMHPLRDWQRAKLRHSPASRVPSRRSGTGSGMGG